MKYLLVLTFDFEEGEDNSQKLIQAIEKLDPPSLPGFTGQLRVTFDPYATRVEQFLDL